MSFKKWLPICVATPMVATEHNWLVKIVGAWLHTFSCRLQNKNKSCTQSVYTHYNNIKLTCTLATNCKWIKSRKQLDTFFITKDYYISFIIKTNIVSKNLLCQQLDEYIATLWKTPVLVFIGRLGRKGVNKSWETLTISKGHHRSKNSHFLKFTH